MNGFKKKLVCLMLVIATICLSSVCVTGCGNSENHAPETEVDNANEIVLTMEKTYSSADELAQVIIDNEAKIFNNESAKEAIAQNKSIKAFLQEDNASNGLAQRLEKAHVTPDNILELYSLCNRTTWYAGLLMPTSTGGVMPLFFYTDRYYPNADKIVAGIKKEFKDPQSVSIDESSFKLKFYYNEDDIDNAVAKGLNYVYKVRVLIYARVRATNGFGAYISQGCYISYTYPNTFSVYMQDNSPLYTIATTMGTYKFWR